MTFEIIEEIIDSRNEFIHSISKSMIHPNIITFIEENKLECFHTNGDSDNKYISFTNWDNNIINILCYDLSNQRYATQNAILRVKG
jgi:hypothetical protein